jgi:hypothetical protein
MWSILGIKTENLHLTLLSINRLNQTEPAAFSDLLLVDQTFKGPLSLKNIIYFSKLYNFVVLLQF